MTQLWRSLLALMGKDVTPKNPQNKFGSKGE